MSSGYRLAPPLAARLVGSLLVSVAGLILVLTVVSAVLRWSPWVVVGAGAGAVALVVVAALVVRRTDVVSLDDDGYRVRLVRGAGVTSARWADATDALTASPAGIDCLVIRLRDGGTTTIPVSALAADRDAFAADVRDHLRRAEGLRPL
jgi:malic enzyme